ncbi:MAG: copper amine oxidase N-terminal domain-containing protein [Bacillota bacterium]|nr:copper amine oxidase N-terminal domain-containing protein [Bacillota bacterium]
MKHKRLVNLLLVFALLAMLWLPAGPAMASDLNLSPDLDLSGVTDETLGAVGGLFDTTGQLLGTTAGAVASTLDTTTDATGQMVKGLTGSVGDLVGDVGDVTGNLVGTLGDLLGGVVGGLGQTTGDLVSKAGKGLGTPGSGKVVVTFRLGDTHYYINGKAVAMDVAPYARNGRCYLPARYVGYSLMVAPDDIEWNQATRTATLTKNGTSVRLTVGSKIMYVNNMAVQIDAPAEAAPPGRIMLPYRWVAEAFGATVDWDQDTKTVTIEYEA